ncbi:MAG: diguanylate cyclase, partial [Thiobacillus sp.]|nr:diguanylate cyclase [Thiobacillus sp.]
MPTETATLLRMQAARRIARPTAWKLALLVGFVTQLLLIVFVTAIGLQQLGVTTRNLHQVVDVHMRKQNYTKRMVVAARERTVILLILPQIRDPLERDSLLQKFREQGTDFGVARLALLAMPLSAKEAELVSRQGQLTAAAQPIQLQVIDLMNADFIKDATELVLHTAIPMQNEVMSVLSQLENETQSESTAASQRAREDHAAARFWMYLLSGAALLVGLLVAAVVFYFAARISREREQLVSLDTLTGLPNRTLFMDRLEQSLIRAKRYNTQIGVMFIDLDRFK